MAKASKSKVPPKKKTIKPFEFESIDESLTDRQKLFCMYYTGECLLNGTKAAEKAGYEPKNARNYACYLLNNPNISKQIELCKKDLGMRIGVTAEMIANEYKRIAFANIKDYIDESNHIVSVKTLEDGKAAPIASIKKTVTEFESGSKTVLELKMHDKINGLDKLARMTGHDGVTKVAETNPEGSVKESPLEMLIKKGGSVTIGTKK